jgi:ferritin-like metal-binding protein YciE
MKGLVEEGQEHVEEHERGLELDLVLELNLVLAASAEKVEHYEIAGYMTARYLAKTIGQRAVAGLMQETLREEEQTGNLILQIAERLQREMKQGGTASSPAANRRMPNRQVQNLPAGSLPSLERQIRRWFECDHRS